MSDAAKEKRRDELLIQFTNYERSVWVVNAVQGHLAKWYADLLKCFDRYPRLPRKDQAPLTPDFTALLDGPYVLLGETKRALGASDVSLEKCFLQLSSYDGDLTIKSSPNGGYDFKTDEHDILVLINTEYALKETKKLMDRLSEARKDGAFVRNLVVFAVAYDTQQMKDKWILSWVTESEKLRDNRLPTKRRLSKRHQDEGEAIVIYPDDYLEFQATHHFCNDDPPAIYLAVLLWSRVFFKLIPLGERQAWVEGDCTGILAFETDVGVVAKAASERLGYTVAKQQVRNVVELLRRSGLVKKEDQDAFLVRYKRFSPRFEEGVSEKVGAERKLDHVKTGIINAIAQLPPPKPRKSRTPARRRRRVKPSGDQLNLF